VTGERTLPTILLATNNPGKVREFRRLLEPFGFTVQTPTEAGIALDVEETGATYADNAILKATAFAEAGQCLALADDSGIEVDALEGGPGMFSARFGGPGLDDVGRTALLLRELRGIPSAGRGARYRAIVAIAWPAATAREPVTFEGVQEGRIALEPIGEGGFGYDPVFLVDERRTQAQINDAEKDDISHRGKAVRAAARWLVEHLD
jgi:XTP/dITP diphosphohydrolase